MPIPDDDKPAIAALLMRYTRWWRERDRDQKFKEKLDARLEKYPEQFAQLKSAFGLFGITGFTTADWQNLQKELGYEIYSAAVNKVPGVIPLPEIEEMKPQPSEAVSVEDAVSEGEKAWDEIIKSLVAEGDQTTDQDKGSTVRDLTLEKLKEAGSKGARAADIRKYIEDLRGTVLHEKTVGMTLYRLAKEGAARRQGRIWFFVEPLEEETKNPGGDTPGLINREDGKGEEL